MSDTEKFIVVVAVLGGFAYFVLKSPVAVSSVVAGPPGPLPSGDGRTSPNTVPDDSGTYLGDASP